MGGGRVCENIHTHAPPKREARGGSGAAGQADQTQRRITHIMLNKLCSVYNHLAFYTTFKLHLPANAAVQHTPTGPMLTINLDLCHAHVRLC